MKATLTEILKEIFFEQYVFVDQIGFYIKLLNQQKFEESIGRELDCVQVNHLKVAENTCKLDVSNKRLGENT